MLKKISRNSFLELVISLPSKAAIGGISIYKKLVSPLLPASCRFYPSCSSYSIDAFRAHGFVRGMLLSLWRVVRCNPFGRGGFDPVK